MARRPRDAIGMPRLRAGLSIAPRDGATLITSARLDRARSITDPTGVWHALLDACDGSRDVASLRRELARHGHALTVEEIAEGIADLERHGVLVDGALDIRDEWSNQRAYFETFARPGHSAAAMHDAVTSTSVLVLGAGGVGSWLAQALAMMGVRELRVVDADRVEARNLSRQPYARDTVGLPKVEALGRRLSALRSDLAYRGIAARVEDHRDLAVLAHGVDVVVSCADEPSLEAVAELVSRACIEAGITHTLAAYNGPVARIGPTWIAASKDSACFMCVSTLRDQSQRAHSLVGHELRSRRREPMRVGVTVAQAQLVAAMIAAEVMHLRAGLRPATDGNIVAIDLRSMRSRRSRVRRNPDCPLCGSRARERASAGERA